MHCNCTVYLVILCENYNLFYAKIRTEIKIKGPNWNRNFSSGRTGRAEKSRPMQTSITDARYLCSSWAFVNVVNENKFWDHYQDWRAETETRPQGLWPRPTRTQGRAALGLTAGPDAMAKCEHPTNCLNYVFYISLKYYLLYDSTNDRQL